MRKQQQGTGLGDRGTKAEHQGGSDLRARDLLRQQKALLEAEVDWAGRNEAPPPGAPVCVAGGAAESHSTMRSLRTGQSGGPVAFTLGTHAPNVQPGGLEA